MGLSLVVGSALLYIALLFLIAWRVDRRADRGVSVVHHPYVYALSLAVYCTAWTFFGSVGRAATGGMIFLGVYLGPSLLSPLWYLVLRKMIVISKNLRITSIADFISSRYGKSSKLAVLVTVIAVLGIVPYISIQLRAVIFGINTLTGFKPGAQAIWLDAGLYVTIAMALFTLLFGTRKLDPNERHEGLVAAVAFESMVKLLAFFAVGIFVTFYLYDGFYDLFSQALRRPDTGPLFSFTGSGVSSMSWNILMMLSLFAVVLLPRQFHISVVENSSPRHIPTAMWVFPLYLLLINIFVFPVALAGKMLFDPSVLPDTYVLNLPLKFGAPWLALIAFIGGFSAATSMIVVETTALSIMFSNHIVVPLLFRVNRLDTQRALVSGIARLLDIRRLSIIFMLFLAYWYHKLVGTSYDLVSVGLISFTAVAQLAPAVIGALYWKRATEQGAMAGMLLGFFIWAYCLPLPSIAQAGYLPLSFVQNGLFGLSFLRPGALFGLTGLDPVTHAAFWSLLLNSWIFAVVSINTKPTALNLTQADLFVNIHKYVAGQEWDILKREAKIQDIRHILTRFLSEERAEAILQEYELLNQVNLTGQKMAQTDLVNFAETKLAGAVGAATARLIIEQITKEDPISIDEVMRILEQTREAVEYSKVMEQKNLQLEALTQQLTRANEQLKALDSLKADFITTVTHELRTPVTSIKALSKILLDYRAEISESQSASYLNILVAESERISRLINQVLDLEKLQQAGAQAPVEALDLRGTLQATLESMDHLFAAQNIDLQVQLPDSPVWITGNKDHLTQVAVNLLSNALKFCDPRTGVVQTGLEMDAGQVLWWVQDNGRGIPQASRQFIFDKFTQLNSAELGKPKGTGLGLFICKTILEQHGGSIRVCDAQPWPSGARFEMRLPERRNAG